MDEPARPPCSTCSRPWSPDGFYVSSTECRACKRDRSRQNRLATARKVALAERLIDTLARLTSESPAAHLCPVMRDLSAARQAIPDSGPTDAAQCSAGRARSTNQEVRP